MESTINSTLISEQFQQTMESIISSTVLDVKFPETLEPIVNSSVQAEQFPKTLESTEDYYVYQLYALNKYEATTLIPVTAYLVILMIIGVIGNILVLYVYKFRFRRSTSRVFILSLAAFDLITCLFGMPYHILDTRFPYTFVWTEVCKGLSFALTFTILGSIFVLDLIAIDRFRKICTPFNKQLSATKTKIICWLTVLISGILAVPILFLYGAADIDTRISNVTGKECYISDEFVDTSFPVIFDAFHICVFAISVLLMAGLYIKVGIVIRNRKKFHENISGSERVPSEQEIPLGSFKNIPVNDITLESMKQKDSVVRQKSNTSIIKNNSINSSSPFNSPRISRKDKKSKFKKAVKRVMSDVSSSENDSVGTLERGHCQTSRYAFKKQRRTIRITGMLFIITLIFVISFLPYLIIEVMSNNEENFWKDMESWEIVIYNLLMRTYFINNMINPVVYWCLDKKFKEEVTRVFSSLVHCRLPLGKSQN